jgi:hypothetical protein
MTHPVSPAGQVSIPVGAMGDCWRALLDTVYPDGWDAANSSATG